MVRAMSTRESLLSEIDGFLSATGIAETTFGLKVVNDGKFVGRLRAGGDVTGGTVDRVRAFIARHQTDSRTPSPSQGAAA